MEEGEGDSWGVRRTEGGGGLVEGEFLLMISGG